MKAKDLSISSKVYTVTPDEIISVSIEAIGKINNRIRITIDRYCYDTNEDAEVIETMNDNFFLNFNQAQEEQSRLREEVIRSRFEDMSRAITDPETNRETLQKYTLDGYVIGDGANNNGDLFMKPEKKEGWINVFINASYFGSKTAGTIYPTKEEALKDVDTKSPHYIDTVKIEWEE